MNSEQSMVVKLQRLIGRQKNVEEIGKMYESMVVSVPWKEVAEYVKNDCIFRLLYKQMWHRQISSPTLQQRIDSWSNYCQLFEVVFTEVFVVLPMRLPYQWLWDMVDDFVNQFQSFSEYMALESKTEQDIALLSQSFRAWSVYDAVNLLQGLLENSKILEQAKDGELQLLTATKEDGSCRNALEVIGYFSMVGLLRLHCLLGNYETGLNCLRPIDLSQQGGFYTTLIATHITTVFHYGFASLMLGRYVDAIREFNNILVYIFNQPQQESPQILNKIDQMYALLAVCLLRCPQLRLIDQCVYSQLLEKYGDKLQRYDDVSLYRELLSYAWPTFSTPFAPNSGVKFYNEVRLALAYPTPFEPCASNYVKPLVNHNQLERVIADMLALKLK